MEIYQYDQAIDATKRKIAKLKHDLASLENFLAEVIKASGEFNRQVANRRASARRMRNLGNSRPALRMGEMMESLLAPRAASSGFEPIKTNVDQEITRVTEELERQKSALALYERGRDQKVAEERARQAAEEAARAAEAANSTN